MVVGGSGSVSSSDDVSISDSVLDGIVVIDMEGRGSMDAVRMR